MKFIKAFPLTSIDTRSLKTLGKLCDPGRLTIEHGAVNLVGFTQSVHLKLGEIIVVEVHVLDSQYLRGASVRTIIGVYNTVAFDERFKVVSDAEDGTSTVERK